MTDRRTFLKRAVSIVNGVIAFIIAVPAVRYLLDPLGRARKQGTFTRVLPLSALPTDDPAQAAVIADRSDAYTVYPPGIIGNVFLVREKDDAHDPHVRCMQVICPHLGCAVAYQRDRHSFACPCHASDFDKMGHRRAGPAPRDMDTLECRITEPDAAGQRWIEVKYEEFQTGIAEKRRRT